MCGKFAQGRLAASPSRSENACGRSAALIHFPRISDVEKRKERTEKFLFALCRALSDKSRHSVHVWRGMCAHYNRRRFLSFRTGGTRKYDNLVCLACFIRRYFSNVTFCYLSHVAPTVHTCTLNRTLECPLRLAARENSNH